MDKFSSRQKIAIAVAVPASLGLLYLLFRKREEDYDSRFRPSEMVAVKEQMTVQVNVPQNRVGAVIGRDGVNIKKIRQETGARLNFQNDCNLSNEEPRLLVISGSPDSVVRAEQLLQEIVRTPDLQTVEMLIPTKAVGRIIGKGGNNIRSICRTSGARVRIPREEQQHSNPDAFRLCFIKGTPVEIAAAKEMIEDGINAEEDYGKRLDEAAANRKQRIHKTGGQQEEVKQPEQVRCPSHGDFFMVYVSAVEHPQHFWMQIITDKSKELDLLIQNMTEYYSQNRNQEVHKAETLCTGDIFAAPFEFDNSWYRGRIEGFLEDGTVDVYFVDYGDFGSVPRSSMLTLRADFLSLPFQAVESSLDGISPKDEKWSEEAVDAFEELSYNARWKPLMARITGYQRTEWGTTLPNIELVDTSSEVDLDIATELVKRGFAKDKRHSSALLKPKLSHPTNPVSADSQALAEESPQSA